MVLLPEPKARFQRSKLRFFGVPGFPGTYFFGGYTMVHFVGAGPGAPDLITIRGAALLRTADQVIYAGSLVNPALLQNCREDCRILNSARMTLEEVLTEICWAEAQAAL